MVAALLRSHGQPSPHTLQAVDPFCMQTSFEVQSPRLAPAVFGLSAWYVVLDTRIPKLNFIASWLALVGHQEEKGVCWGGQAGAGKVVLVQPKGGGGGGGFFGLFGGGGPNLEQVRMLAHADTSLAMSRHASLPWLSGCRLLLLLVPVCNLDLRVPAW